MCHFGSMGVKQTLNKSRHRKVILENRILLLLLLAVKSVTF